MRKYSLLFLGLLLIINNCRRNNKILVKDYQNEFPWKGISKAENSYNNLNIHFCNYEVKSEKFKSPGVVLAQKKTYTVTVKFKFICVPANNGSNTDQQLFYRVRFIDSCGNLRCLQASKCYCKADPSPKTAITKTNSNSENMGRMIVQAKYMMTEDSDTEEEVAEDEEGEEEEEDADAAAEEEEEEEEQKMTEDECSQDGMQDYSEESYASSDKLQKCITKGDDYSGNSCSLVKNKDLDSIQFKVTSGYPMYLSVSGYGPRNSGVEASISATADDGSIEIPIISTKQVQNNDGSAQLQEPLCQYIILP